MVQIEQHVWGMTPEGEAIILYTMRNDKGAEVKISNFGAAIVSVTMPDREGRMADGMLVAQHHVGHAALAVGHLHRDDRRAVVRELHFGSRVVAQRVANDCLALRGHAPDVLFDLYHSLI